MIKLSIVTINFNNVWGLEKTINSVIEQDFEFFEYIIIDGGSNDESVSILENNSERISYWVSEPDRGIYHAMNKGILKAKGEYIQFLNSGDWFVNKSVLSKVFSSEHTEDIIYGNMIKVYPDGRQVTDKGPQRSTITLGDMYFRTLNHSSAFIKRTLFDMYGLYEENYKIVSDWAFFLKAIGLNDSSVKYVDIDINYFDMTGISNSQLKQRFAEKKEVLTRYIPPKYLPDYQQMEANINKAFLFDKIRNNKILWNLIRIYNKIFYRSIW